MLGREILFDDIRCMDWVKRLRGITPAILEDDRGAAWVSINEFGQVVSRVVNDDPARLAATMLADL